jgi:hypothetical protein
VILFLNTKRAIAQQATRAMYSLIKKARDYLLMPIDLQIELFMKTVKPILLIYGCKKWGYGNLDMIEKIKLNFLIFYNVKASTPNSIIYGATGVQQLIIDIKTRMISFWSNLNLPKI